MKNLAKKLICLMFVISMLFALSAVVVSASNEEDPIGNGIIAVGTNSNEEDPIGR